MCDTLLEQTLELKSTRSHSLPAASVADICRLQLQLVHSRNQIAKKEEDLFQSVSVGQQLLELIEELEKQRDAASNSVSSLESRLAELEDENRRLMALVTSHAREKRRLRAEQVVVLETLEAQLQETAEQRELHQSFVEETVKPLRLRAQELETQLLSRSLEACDSPPPDTSDELMKLRKERDALRREVHTLGETCRWRREAEQLLKATIKSQSDSIRKLQELNSQTFIHDRKQSTCSSVGLASEDGDSEGPTRRLSIQSDQILSPLSAPEETTLNGHGGAVPPVSAPRPAFVTSISCGSMRNAGMQRKGSAQQEQVDVSLEDELIAAAKSPRSTHPRIIEEAFVRSNSSRSLLLPLTSSSDVGRQMQRLTQSGNGAQTGALEGYLWQKERRWWGGSLWSPSWAHADSRGVFLFRTEKRAQEGRPEKVIFYKDIRSLKCESQPRVVMKLLVLEIQREVGACEILQLATDNEIEQEMWSAFMRQMMRRDASWATRLGKVVHSIGGVCDTLHELIGDNEEAVSDPSVLKLREALTVAMNTAKETRQSWFAQARLDRL
eukprot:TRINITY_DN4983_c0_g1_i1.p1 TRINITY_DN4983_c0_g1~~TRINITY_DN4983_c0_g1_i1.p1  ORF type:complete len:570 (-),score=88.95 TRINITY_DN4983_c0_g1_i1:304-1968(-)